MQQDYLHKAFVYTTDINYSDEAKVLTYSLRTHHPDDPIFLILCYREWQNRNYEGIMEKFKGFNNLKFIQLPEGLSWNKQIKARYQYACNLGQLGFNSVCILDADMLCLYNLDLFFKIASGGIIVACADNTVTKWTNKEIEQYFNDHPTEHIEDVQERVSNVPWFFNPHEQRVREMLCEMNEWDNHDQCDYTLLNYFMFKHKIMDITLLTNSYQFTNIHHSMLKPDTFAKDYYDQKGQQIFSEQGQRVYMIHGHWHDPAYLTGLMEPMERNYSWHPRSLGIARNVIAFFQKIYEKNYEEAMKI